MFSTTNDKSASATDASNASIDPSVRARLEALANDIAAIRSRRGNKSGLPFHGTLTMENATLITKLLFKRPDRGGRLQGGGLRQGYLDFIQRRELVLSPGNLLYELRDLNQKGRFPAALEWGRPIIAAMCFALARQNEKRTDYKDLQRAQYEFESVIRKEWGTVNGSPRDDEVQLLITWLRAARVLCNTVGEPHCEDGFPAADWSF